MSTYRRHEGFVEITTDELAARCSRCKKALVYEKGKHLSWWKELLKAFVRKHRNCK